MKNLKIIHLSESDITGGSAYYAYRISKFMNEQKKIKSKMYVLTKNSQDKNIVKFTSNGISKFWKKFYYFLLKENNKYSFYNYGNYVIKNYSQISDIIREKPNALIIYNNSNFIHPKIISFLSSKNIKVIFYLMDMELITGGCHYNFKCNGYKNNCQICPATGVILKNLPQKILNEKKKYFYEKKINFISPNSVTYNDVSKSSIFNKKLHINHKLFLGLNLRTYKPKKMKKTDDKIIISMRSSLNPRKGNHLLIDALNYLSVRKKNLNKKIFFNIVGDSNITNFLKKKKFNFRFTPYIKNEKQLVKFYQESDFFLNQSIQDLGPFMVNESLACGIPVLSFKIGIAKDIIKSGYNGFILKKISSKLLANELIKLSTLNKTKLKIIKNNSRNTAMKYFDIKKQVQKILQISK